MLPDENSLFMRKLILMGGVDGGPLFHVMERHETLIFQPPCESSTILVNNLSTVGEFESYTKLNLSWNYY